MQLFSKLSRPLCALTTLSFVSGMEVPQEERTFEITGSDVLHHLTINLETIDDSDRVTIKDGILGGNRPGSVINIEKLATLLQADPDLESLDFKLALTFYYPHHIKYILTRKVIDTIFTHAPHLKSLELRNNTLSYMGAEALFGHLKNNTTLKILDLSNTDFGNNSDFSRCTLDFERNNNDQEVKAPEDKMKAEIGPGEMLMEIQNFLLSDEPLPHQHLDGSSDTMNRDVDCLIECLTHNTTLDTLILSDNHLSTSDFERILPTLEKHFPTHTIRLDLRGNFIQFEQSDHYEPKIAVSTSNLPSNIDIRNQRMPNSGGDGNCIIS